MTPYISPLRAAENAILAELQKRLHGNKGRVPATDYEQFLSWLPTDDLTSKAFNNLRVRQQLLVWRPKAGAAKVIGFNPEYNSEFALPALTGF